MGVCFHVILTSFSCAGESWQCVAGNESGSTLPIDAFFEGEEYVLLAVFTRTAATVATVATATARNGAFGFVPALSFAFAHGDSAVFVGRLVHLR